MSSKRRLRRNACEKKVKYKDQTEAVINLKRLVRSISTYQDVHTYKCTFCHKWHLGHKKEYK